jgi:site-specific DNA recombinase
VNTLLAQKAAREAVILARVSSKEQQEGYSLSAQERLLQDYCNRGGLEGKKVFRIAETASKSKQRLVFAGMMLHIEKNSIKVLIVEKVDRLVRNFKDTVMIDDWLEADEARQVHFVKDSLILHKNSRSQEKLNWGIRVVMAKNYTDNLKEEVEKARIEKLLDGWLPGVPPLGYKNIGEPKHRIQVIDDEIKPLIKLMFELYDTGNYSTKSLATEMKNQGLRTRKDKPLGKTHVWELLTNRYYTGKIVWCKKEYQGKHEPLIDAELFQRIQARLTRGVPPKYSKHNQLFKGLIQCEECKGTITWELQKGMWYGHCSGYKPCTRKKYAKQDDIEQQAIAYFEALKSPHPALVAWVKKELRASHQDEIEVHTASTEQLSRRKDKLDKMLDELYDDKLEGRISATKYDEKSTAIAEEQTAILTALGKLGAAKVSFINQGFDILELTQRAAEIYQAKDSQDERRALLRDIFSNIGLNGQTLLGNYRNEIAAVFDKVERVSVLEQTFEHDENGSIKEKAAFDEAARSIWRARPVSNRRSPP